MLDDAPFSPPAPLPPETRRIVCGGASPERRGRRRESSRGCEARSDWPGSMSQQPPARKLPSLLVDPAEETVRRRCRDPINVEGLLVSPPGVGGGQRRACGGSPGPWGSRSACHVLWTRAVVFRWNALPYPFHVLQNNCQPPRSFLRPTEQCWRKLNSLAWHWRALPSLSQWISASSLFRVLCSLLCPSPTQLQPLETLSTPHMSHPTAPLSFGPQSSVGVNCTALPDTGMLAHFYLSGSLQALFFMFSAASSPILLSCSRLKPCPHLTPHSSPHSSRCRLTSSLTVKTRGRLRLPVKRLILLLLWTACSVFSLIIRTFLWKKPVSSHFSLHSRPFCWFLPVTSK